MRIIRSYITEALHVGQELALSEAASNHLVRVLRLGVDDTCVLFVAILPKHLMSARNLFYPKLQVTTWYAFYALT